MASNKEVRETNRSGDLELVIGEEKARLLVTSAVMKTASPVFAAMLGPGFSEGEQLASSQSHGKLAELLLPEDNFGAFDTLSKLLHHRMSPKYYPSPQHLLEVAILVDKYDFVSAMNFASTAWITKLLESEDPGEHWALAISSALLRQPECFRKATAHLVEEGKGSFFKEATLTHDKEFGLALALRLEECRCHDLLTVSFNVFEMTRELTAAHRKCKCGGPGDLCFDYLDKLTSRCTLGFNLWEDDLAPFYWKGDQRSRPERYDHPPKTMDCRVCRPWIDIQHATEWFPAWARPGDDSELKNKIRRGGLCLGCLRGQLYGERAGEGLHDPVAHESKIMPRSYDSTGSDDGMNE